jgi:predicted AlkP superfamily phosphohydrolase/phosphomutase
MTRIMGLLLGICLLLAPLAAARTPGPQGRLVMLGIDGLDPGMLEELMDAGKLPAFAELRRRGHFGSLETSIPPQSPVAWSDFITGTNPGHHGIFDFIALDRQQLTPYMSTARVHAGAAWKLGRWRIPLGGAGTELLRKGRAFWELLEEAGVPTTIFRVPANYPPVETAGRALSGMGTPDLRGSPGTFSFFTSDPAREPGPVSGGEIERVHVLRQRVAGRIEGPPNAFVEGAPRAGMDFEVHVDPENPVAEIRIDGQRIVLQEGEWSEWARIRFELVPVVARVSGLVRFYLKRVRPHFELYASPVNIDPAHPAQPIAAPAAYAKELSEAVGPFYTQEMPEDTKALSADVLEPTEFVAQSELVLDERRRLLRHELERFLDEQKRGLLFFYFSSIDQRSHMLWRHMDSGHPFHEAGTPSSLVEAVRDAYISLDRVLADVLSRVDAGTDVVVMSDHGFAPFRRQAHLNAWLERNGYLALRAGARRDARWLSAIDWSRTRAFAVGLNSLYLNVAGREKHGIIAPTQRGALAREIATRLGEWRDPASGAAVVTQPLVREDAYSGPELERAPDVLVGYARGYRASWATTRGEVPETTFADNDREWSGDHCMDSRSVPGTLLTSFPVPDQAVGLRDLTSSILAYFAVDPAPQMSGRSVF